MAEEGKLDPVVGRERNRTCLPNFEPVKEQPLLNLELENPIAEGLALRIIQESVKILFNKRVVTLTLQALLLELNTEDSLKAWKCE
jgi:ATP-dependent Clp protease ATP-binding subunit ClpA